MKKYLLIGLLVFIPYIVSAKFVAKPVKVVKKVQKLVKTIKPVNNNPLGLRFMDSLPKDFFPTSASQNVVVSDAIPTSLPLPQTSAIIIPQNGNEIVTNSCIAKKGTFEEQIVNLKNKYYQDIIDIDSEPIDMSLANGQKSQLFINFNNKINQINLDIQQLKCP